MADHDSPQRPAVRAFSFVVHDGPTRRALPLALASGLAILVFTSGCGGASKAAGSGGTNAGAPGQGVETITFEFQYIGDCLANTQSPAGMNAALFDADSSTQLATDIIGSGQASNLPSGVVGCSYFLTFSASGLRTHANYTLEALGSPQSFTYADLSSAGWSRRLQEYNP